MKIAVLIDGNRLLIAYAYDSLRLVLEVNTDTTVLCLDIDERDVVLWEHRVGHAAYLNLDCAVIKLCNYRYMLLKTCIYCSRYKLHHLLTATNHWNLAVNNLLDNIAAMATLKEFHCHITLF